MREIDLARQLVRYVDATTEPVVSDPTALEQRRVRRSRQRRTLALIAAAIAVIGVSIAVLLSVDGDSQSVEVVPADTGPTEPVEPTTAPAATTAPATSTTAPPPPSTTPGDDSTQGALLPDGTPSAPHIGELVVSSSTTYSLYADGRLIWWSQPVAGGPGRFVEQRLTSEGVEQVRTELLATGLFDAAQPSFDGIGGYGCICVRGDDGGLLTATQKPATGGATLLRYFSTLESSLPESAWADKEIKPYVASRIEVCIATYLSDPDQVVQVPHDPSVLVPLLSEQAPALLGDRVGPSPPDDSCFEVTLEEARTLADEFLSSSVGGSHEYWGIAIRDERFDVIQPDAPEGIVVYVTFGALLPNGPAASVV